MNHVLVYCLNIVNFRYINNHAVCIMFLYQTTFFDKCNSHFYHQNTSNWLKTGCPLNFVIYIENIQFYK